MTESKYKEIKKYIEVDSGSNCKLLSTSEVKIRDKLKILCQCGETYEIIFSDFKRRKTYKCYKCRKRKIWNIDMVREYVLKNGNGTILISEEYIHQDKLLKFKCICGEIFETTFARFVHFNKNTCLKCSGKTNWDYEKVKKEIEKTNGLKLVSTEYKNTKEKLKIKCNCGNIFETCFDNFLKKEKNKCNICSMNKKIKKLTKTNDDFVKEVFNLVGEEYLFLEKYIDNRTKIKCIHNKCNTVWDISPDNFLRGRGCPNCKRSIGEEKIEKFLLKNNIIFQTQYKFKDCINKRPLPFDFYIKDYNILIEFDGEQHHRQINYYGGEEGFKYRLKNDNIKTEYCKNNNIKLIRISYLDILNIDNILSIELNLY